MITKVCVAHLALESEPCIVLGSAQDTYRRPRELVPQRRPAIFLSRQAAAEADEGADLFVGRRVLGADVGEELHDEEVVDA